MMSAFIFQYRCQFLGPPYSPVALPVSIEFGSAAEDPGAGCMFAKMQSDGLLSKGSVEHQGIHKPVQTAT